MKYDSKEFAGNIIKENLSVSDFGVNHTKTESPIKEQLLKEIYCLSEGEAKHILDIIKSVSAIRKLK